ncbi:MAG: bifunctional phosphopantothenoylcysteine decarboxylase/phosphopantothenate--cysteine ligase CoaBC [Actinobacteria bacterium]|nr:bifunctional phosphopantothenoylcysteine decarboxylase/phosphopantothenate--cysteine ligase CoaBC [Actinomycetota bacterium]
MSQHIVLGVGGGIAAYKSCELLRRLTENGHDVRVVPTQAALEFVGRATWEALSGNPVTTTVFDNVDEVAHVRIAQHAKLVVIAPATADLLARMAAGRGDDLLTSTLLMTTSPVIAVPAMHTEMWRHPATVANVETLRSRGIRVMDPADGRLTGADSGPGRLPEPSAIAEVCEAVLTRDGTTQDLAGVRVTISAGGTREPIDPVRYLGNRSSGRQGWALAAAAVARGAIVNVVAANVDRADPVGAKVTRVRTSEDLHAQMVERSRDADVVIMAAAVADFRARDISTSKIKKSDSGDGIVLNLERTTDVLAELGAVRSEGGPILVGFAAETEPDERSLVVLAQGKLAAKGADLIVANEVGTDRGFEESDNQVVIVSADGIVGRTERTSKFGVANGVLDAVSHLL